MLMLNKNKTEDNFFTACKVSLSFSDLEERKKKKKNQEQPGPNWSIWQFYLGRETIKPLKG